MAEINGPKIAAISPYPAEKPKDEERQIVLSGTGGIILKVREIIKMIEADGWYLVTTRGSQ